ncbi:hypothetical protein Q9306_06195 [Bacillus sp. WLY-B-L8]|nr:hypothetical protein [Bacillus sp. WLY-B-L8]
MSRDRIKAPSEIKNSSVKAKKRIIETMFTIEKISILPSILSISSLINMK